MNIMFQYKHDRNIDNKDKYFIVNIMVNNVLCETGVIEKQFIEQDFIKQLKTKIGDCDIKIINVRELSKKEYYKQKTKQL